MAVGAGDLDRRIRFERSVSTRNELNEPVEAWQELSTVWARRRDASDGEKDASEQRGATLMSRFVIRSSPESRDFKPTDRIVYDGGEWNILGIKEADLGRNRFLEVTAIRNIDRG